VVPSEALATLISAPKMSLLGLHCAAIRMLRFPLSLNSCLRALRPSEEEGENQSGEKPANMGHVGHASNIRGFIGVSNRAHTTEQL
jgi:hypothetical protein